MTRARLWTAGILLAAVGSAAARGGGRGGGLAGGGFSRGGTAASGSLGQGGRGGGGFTARGPAASGTFAGQQPSGGYGGWQDVGGGRDAVARQQRERLGRLGPPDRQAEQQGRLGDAREDQALAPSRQEDWQDYVNDHDDDHDDHPPAGAIATGVVVGAAVGAAAAAPAGWTLPCAPTTVVVDGTTYYQCGSAWYIRAYSGGDVAYTMGNPPAGY
jgi:hypothetical protein